METAPQPLARHPPPWSNGDSAFNRGIRGSGDNRESLLLPTAINESGAATSLMLAATVKEMTPQRLCCLRAATPPQPLAMQHTAGASALKASVTGTVYSVVAVYTAASAATKCSGAAITADAGATDSADTVATNSATGAVVAHLAGAGAAGSVSTDAMYSTTDADMAYPAGTSATRETTGTVVVFSSTDQTQGQVPCVTPRPMQEQMQCAPSSTQMLQALLSWCDVHHLRHKRCSHCLSLVEAKAGEMYSTIGACVACTIGSPLDDPLARPLMSVPRGAKLFPRR